MRPESILGIALDLVETVALPGGYPADARVGRFFRQRRFLGSRDRRFLGAVAYGWLRRQLAARAAWRAGLAPRSNDIPSEEEVEASERWLAERDDPEELDLEAKSIETRPAGASLPARLTRLRTAWLLDLLALAAAGHLPWSVEEALEAARALPEERHSDELWRSLREGLLPESLRPASEPPATAVGRVAAAGSLPRWIAEALLAERSEEEATELARALLEPAPVDLRVNSRRARRETARRVLSEETKLEIEPTHFSPLGLRLPHRCNLTATRASRKGWIEIQDEGSQLAVLVTDPRPGATVIEACAGSGGKSLALAGIVGGEGTPGTGDAPASWPRGHVYACDIDRERLVELRRRAREAGVEETIHIVPIYPSGELPEPLPEADLVLVDAPCTGLGTLRRSPELKRRWSTEDAESFRDRQLEILARFAAKVRPGGRLALITCSFLPAEGEEVAASFEALRADFTPVLSQWAAKRLPPACLGGQRVRLDPARTATDAFFIAVWRREGELERPAEPLPGPPPE